MQIVSTVVVCSPVSTLTYVCAAFESSCVLVLPNALFYCSVMTPAKNAVNDIYRRVYLPLTSEVKHVITALNSVMRTDMSFTCGFYCIYFMLYSE